MIYKLNFQNTGYIEDGVLTINTVKNELGYPDGTVITIDKLDDFGNVVARKQIDIVDLIKECV